MLLPLKTNGCFTRKWGNTLVNSVFLLETIIFGFDVNFFGGVYIFHQILRREVDKYNLFGGMFWHVEMQFSVLVVGMIHLFGALLLTTFPWFTHLVSGLHLLILYI